MTNYTRNELEAKREKLKKEIHNLDMQRTKDLLNGKIDNFNFQLIGSEVNNMSTQVNNLSSQLVLRDFNQISINEPQPGAMLVAATDKLNEAAEHLDNVHEVLIATALVINVVTDITLELMKKGLIVV